MSRMHPTEWEALEIEFICYPGCGAQPGQWCLTKWGGWAEMPHAARASQATRELARRRKRDTA